MSRADRAPPPLADQVDRYLDHLVVERGVAANTAASYRRDLRRYRDYLIGRGIGDLAEVDESDVREFLVDLRSPGTGEPPPAPLSGVRSPVRSWRPADCTRSLSPGHCGRPPPRGASARFCATAFRRSGG